MKCQKCGRSTPPTISGLCAPCKGDVNNMVRLGLSLAENGRRDRIGLDWFQEQVEGVEKLGIRFIDAEDDCYTFDLGEVPFMRKRASHEARRWTIHEDVEYYDDCYYIDDSTEFLAFKNTEARVAAQVAILTAEGGGS